MQNEPFELKGIRSNVVKKDDNFFNSSAKKTKTILIKDFLKYDANCSKPYWLTIKNNHGFIKNEVLRVDMKSTSIFLNGCENKNQKLITKNNIRKNLRNQHKIWQQIIIDNFDELIMSFLDKAYIKIINEIPSITTSKLSFQKSTLDI
jgi:hypothetical protein